MGFAGFDGRIPFLCRELAKIFLKAVDQAKHGGSVAIPPFLRRRTSEAENSSAILRERDLTDGQLVQNALLRNLLWQPKREFAAKMLLGLGWLNPKVLDRKNADFILVSAPPKTSDFFEMIRNQMFSHQNQNLVFYLSQLIKFNKKRKISKEIFVLFFRPSDSDPTAKVNFFLVRRF